VVTVAVMLAALLTLSSCGSLPVPQNPAAEAFVLAELASLASDGDFDYLVADFSDSRESSRGIDASGVRFESLTANIGFEVGRRVVGDNAPPDGRFVGSTEHLRLMGAGTVRVPSPSTVLGMHVVLTHEQALLHRWIESGTEAQLLVTGIDNRGRETGTIKAVPAISTPDLSRVADNWTWIDLSLLGEVTELRMTFESPVAALPVILIDNFTFSTDFTADSDFFTVALLPSTALYVESFPEILDSQLRYLASSYRSSSGEPIVFVSHLGNIVAHGSEESEWETADEAMRILDASVPYGIVPGLNDLEDLEDPLLGAPFYLHYFPADRVDASGRRSGVSEDGYSSYQVFDTPVGDVLALNLMVDSPPPTMEWAQQILDTYRGVPTMVTMATYLDVVGTMVTRHAAPLLTTPDDSWEGVSAQLLWEELIWHNPQVFMVACGDGSTESLQLSWNRAEQPVVEMLSGYRLRPEGGEGYLRLLRFYPRRNEMRVMTYSPWLNTYEQDADSWVRIPMDITGRLGLE
jgi:Domain of unknown function (DUF4465)